MVHPTGNGFCRNASTNLAEHLIPNSKFGEVSGEGHRQTERNLHLTVPTFVVNFSTNSTENIYICVKYVLLEIGFQEDLYIYI